MVSLSRVDSKVIELEFSAAPRSLHCSLGQKRCLCILESHVLAANAYTAALGAARNLHGLTLRVDRSALARWSIYLEFSASPKGSHSKLEQETSFRSLQV